MRPVFLPAALLPAALLNAVAHGQAVSPIQESVTQGAQIERAIDRATSGAALGDQPSAALPGEVGIYVLRKQDIFFVAGNAEVGYSSNPLRTVDKTGGSALLDGAANAGIRTRLADKLDFSVAATYEATYYFKRFAPSNTAINGTVTLGAPIARTPLYLGATAFGGGNFSLGLKHPVSFHGASAFASAAIPLGSAMLLQPVIAGTRQWTAIHENDNNSVSARLAATWAGKRVSATLSAALSRVWFDNFYEDVTFVRRRDWQYEAGASLTYRATPRLLLGGRLRYIRRKSTFFLATYDAVEGGLSAVLTWRF